jgi:putative tRNA adenosine deaminase-associated protein
MPDGGTDFVVVVYREDDAWQATALPPRVGEDLDELIAAIRRQAAGSSAIGLVSVEDDFFVAVRVDGDDVRLLLSDVTAAGESPIAGEVLEALDLPMPSAEDERVQPAGDLGIFADLGMTAMELGALCDDLDLYPDQMLDSIASRLGFAEPFRRALDAALADETPVRE